MYKFVVFCVVLAAAFAEPEPSAVLAAPSAAVLPYAAGYYPGYAASPYYASSSYYTSPSYYTAPLAYSHYIKKRSAQVYSPALPSSYSYSYSGPAYAAHTYSTPLYSGSIYPSSQLTYSAPAHYIKKRSVAYAALPSTYVAPTTYAAPATPYYAGYAAAAPYYSTPYYGSYPYAYASYIKK